MREEKRSRLPESDLSPRDASFASLFLSLPLPPFFILSLSPSLFRSESLLPAPGLASDVFHQINSRSMREYALLFTPRRRVCIISFIIQLALNFTLFRSHDRSLRPSSSFFPRILSTPGKAPCSTSLARALGARCRHETTFATRPLPIPHLVSGFGFHLRGEIERYLFRLFFVSSGGKLSSS